MLPLLFIGVAEGLLAIFLLGQQPRKKITTLFITAFFIALTLPLLLKLLNFFFAVHGLLVSSLFYSLPFIYGPLLFHYTISTIDESKPWHWKQLGHYLPFILAFFICVMFNISLPHDLGKVKPPTEVPPASPGQLFATSQSGTSVPFNLTWTLAFTLLSISYVAYVILIFIHLRRHRKQLEHFYSSVEEKVTLLWLNWTVFFFFIMGLFINFFTLLLPSLMVFRGIPPGIADVYGLTLFIFIFALFISRQPNLFISSREPLDSEKPAKYERSGLSKEEAVQKAQALEALMARENLYRQSDLTIQDLASLLKIPKHHLTQVINEEFKINFYVYINAWRIKDVLHQFSQNPKESVILVASQAGFNSKATFNRVFKSSTGLSPTEYLTKKAPFQ